MAGSENSLAQTILYLRPQIAEGTEVLDILANEPCVREVAPPEPVDIPLGEIPNLFPTTTFLPITTPHTIMVEYLAKVRLAFTPFPQEF